jgi:hypothetical protein
MQHQFAASTVLRKWRFGIFHLCDILLGFLPFRLPEFHLPIMLAYFPTYVRRDLKEMGSSLQRLEAENQIPVDVLVPLLFAKNPVCLSGYISRK